MASEDALGSPDDGLELERIAVGPYCVFDDFRLPPSPPPAMEDPMMATNFPFGNMREPPWQVHDELGWTDWMTYDPAAASQNPQSVEPKPATDQGPAAFLKPAQQQSPLTAHHPQSQPMQPTSTPTTAPMFAHPTTVPFTFGQSADMSPAFDFAGNALSSPLTADSARQNSYLSPPMWQQQQQQQQQQLPPQQSQHQRHVADNAIFTTNKYSQPAFAAPPPHHSPTSLNNGRASSSSSHSSPEPPVASKKRKLSSDDDDLESPSSSKKEKGQPPKKTAHNMIEKRYRTNLNDKIAALRDSVPSLRVMSRPNGTEEDDDPEDLEGLTPAHKLNKATVLSKATEYIRHLEKRNKRMTDEIAGLQARLDNYEKMAMSGQMNMHANHAGTPDGSRYQEDPFAPAHGMSMHGPTQGMIPVPENIAALQRGLPPQPHYAPAYPQYAPNTRPSTGPPMVNGRRTGGMVGKLMVGSLAGLMVLDGIVEHQQSQGEPADRGLFAFPVHLATRILAPRTSLGVSTTNIPLAKLILVFGAVFWLIAPWLNPKPKSKKKKTAAAVQLKPAPSLASPLEVRQKAWLTAIQTVWVPQHNLLLEVAALGLKTLKLSTRKIIGWPGYAYLTGLTKEQEDARIKAWEIALDAQLTGGDADISKSRLLLTLLASGTLPDTPARLMLKALHIRVLLWEIANTGHGSWWSMDELSAKLARSYWNMARSEHRIASNMASKQDKRVEPLPDHLAALIEKECDDVLLPETVQRAYNLAWNSAGTEKTADDISMDSVVEDSAISSPLDALAAWYSGVVLKKALANTLATKKGVLKDSVVSDLALATQSAPPNSQAQLRALVAQAVVLDDNRTERIRLALEALPSAPPLTDAGFINFVGTAYVAKDICDALTLAKCLSLLEMSKSTARLRAIFRINGFHLCKSTTTLLSFVAGHKILTLFMQDASLQMETGTGLERLASSLRMWVRHGIGKRSGLSTKVRSRIVECCLDATKTLVGLAVQKDEAYIDDGYASASVKDD